MSDTILNNSRIKLASLLEGNTATEKLAGISDFIQKYKWPLIGTAAVGILAISAITLANHAAETSPEYADPRYMNEDGSLLPSFTTIRPLQNENIERLEELIDEKALNKFFANNFNRFNYVKNQDDTYSHVGNTPEWEDEADIYDAYEKEIFGKGGPGHWGYLNDDELPSIEDAKALGFLDHLISARPYYEGQKPISKTASLKTMHKFADDRFSKAIEQIAKNSVNNAIKNDTIAKTKSFGLTGLGLGALSGLGYTYFNSDEDNSSSVSDYIKNGLIGSGIGGVSGAGIGALSGLIPGYRSRTDRINNIIQEAKDHGKMWAHEMEENNGYLDFSGKNRNWDGTIMEKIDDLVSDHNKKIRDKYGPLKNQYYGNSRNNDNKIRRVFADLDNYVPGTGKGEMDGGFRNGKGLHDWLGRIDAFINSGILNKHEADVVRNYVKDINPFDFTYDDLGNVIRAIESSQEARREKAINRLYNYLSTQKTASLKTADFKTRFGQDLGGFLSHMAYGGAGGALLGGLYHDIAGGTPDDLMSDINTGMTIGAALSGLYGGINTHIGMNDRIKRLGDLLAKRFTSGVAPDYQAKTDNLKNIINNLTNGGFMAGLKEVF